MWGFAVRRLNFESDYCTYGHPITGMQHEAVRIGLLDVDHDVDAIGIPNAKECEEMGYILNLCAALVRQPPPLLIDLADSLLLL